MAYTKNKTMETNKIDIERIREKLKNVLPPNRYQHSIGTEQKARELAQLFNVDSDKAALAGLLHDCAKFIKKENMYNFIRDHSITVDEESINSPAVLHAYVSEYLAANEYGISDPDILTAIRNHTLGDINMSDIDKIVFIADKIEDNTRTGAYFDEIREALKITNNLDKTILVSYGQTIKCLVDKKYFINQIAIRNWNYLLEKTQTIKPIIRHIGLYKKVNENNNNNT